MKKLLIIIAFMLPLFSLPAQVEKSSELFETLRVNDSLIFNASFKTCDLIALSKLINEDFEFYHDKAGLMEGKEVFLKNTEDGLCKSEHELKRELREGSLEVFALMNNEGKLYAAIQKGVHSFYENGRFGSTAKFTHLWVIEENKWTLKRVLSYDHKTDN